MHPLGQVPVVEDGDVTIFESGAIVEYLLERYGEGAPRAGTRDAVSAPSTSSGFLFGGGEPGRAHDAHLPEIASGKLRSREPWLADVVTESRGHARAGCFASSNAPSTGGDVPSICGAEFTAADIMVVYGIVVAKIMGELPADLPNIAAYLGRLKARPAYERAWA